MNNKRDSKNILEDLKEVFYNGQNNIKRYYKGTLKKDNYIILDIHDLERIVNLLREALCLK